MTISILFKGRCLADKGRPASLFCSHSRQLCAHQHLAALTTFERSGAEQGESSEMQLLSAG